MNYYEHHLGDYMRDTAHLSLIEDGVYRRLIDAYYAREKPLPTEVSECCKLARVSGKKERDAVRYILREFFQLADDGWRQKRCDEVIEKYYSKKNKARDSANARWNAERSDSDGNADAMRTHSDGNAPNLQSPVTSNQEERKKNPPTPQGGAPKVFEHWQKVFQHPKAILDGKRRRLIDARLQQFSAEDLRGAIDGYKLSPFHQGENKDGKVFDGLELILRDAQHVEEGLRFLRNPPRPPPVVEQLSPVERVLRANGGVKKDERVVAEQFGSSNSGVGVLDGDVRDAPYAGFRRIGS
jgi:uncharacterized protein YdaU (DUF1376 family)